MKLSKDEKNILRHELAFRGEEVLEARAKSLIVICGAGALGSNLSNVLLRQRFNSIRVIDNDKVEAHNIANQFFGKADVGASKVRALANKVFRDLGYKIDSINQKLINSNAKKFFKDASLVVDTFDNFESRSIVKDACEKFNIPCVHAGMSDNGFCEVKWDGFYKIPKVEITQNDVCEYPLSLNLVHFTVCLIAEVIVDFIDKKRRTNIEFTLNDLAISIL